MQMWKWFNFPTTPIEQQIKTYLLLAVLNCQSD